MKILVLLYFFLGYATIGAFNPQPNQDVLPFLAGLTVGYLVLGGVVVYSIVHGTKYGSIFDGEHRTFAILAPAIWLSGVLAGWYFIG